MNPAAMTERLIDAAIYAETASGPYVSGARKELNEARAAIEAALATPTPAAASIPAPAVEMGTIAFIERTIERLDERRKIKYWVPPDSIRENSALRGSTQHMVDPDDLFHAVELLKAFAALAAPASAKVEGPRCEHCDGTGDVHSIDGEWRGRRPQTDEGEAVTMTADAPALVETVADLEPLPGYGYSMPASPAPAASGGLEAVRGALRELRTEASNEDYKEAYRLGLLHAVDRLDMAIEAAALASPAATSAETQGGDGAREALERVRCDCQSTIDLYHRTGPSFTSPGGDEYEPTSFVIAKMEELISIADAALAPSTSAATRGEPVGWCVDIPSFGIAFFHDEAEARAQAAEPNCEGSVVSRVFRCPAPAVESAQVFCDCERGHNGIGISGRVCDCQGPTSEARPDGGKVKTLTWVGPHLKMYVAEPLPGLQYRITCDDRGIDWFFDGGWNPVATLDEAKAAAQADYESRIRASLDLATDAEG